MISFAPGKTGLPLVDRMFSAAQATFALAQSAQDLARAIAAVFRPTTAGTQTLTLGTTAPNSIVTLTPTRWLAVIETDGKATIIPGWR